MKLGIMSMQRITNYGSYLIAFAMQKTFEKLGHSVEFVDFKIEPCLTKFTSDVYLEKLSDKDNRQGAYRKDGRDSSRYERLPYRSERQAHRRGDSRYRKRSNQGVRNFY